jgi:hypothetical protein
MVWLRSVTVSREGDKVKPNGKKRSNLPAMPHPRPPLPDAAAAPAGVLPIRPCADSRTSRPSGAGIVCHRIATWCDNNHPSGARAASPAMPQETPGSRRNPGDRWAAASSRAPAATHGPAGSSARTCRRAAHGPAGSGRTRPWDRARGTGASDKAGSVLAATVRGPDVL